MTVPNSFLRRLRLYTPHSLQLAFHRLAGRFRFTVVAWGRQTGKSTAALNHVLKEAWEHPNHTYWFVSPTGDQAEIQFRRLIGMLWGCRELIAKWNQTKLRVKLINGSQIVFKSGEVFNKLRSESLNGVVIDEVRDQKPGLWTLVLRPMLNTTKGWAIFISTPNGFDAFYDFYEHARLDSSGEWGCMHAPATQCPLYSPEEIESNRKEMSEAEFAQEIMAEFRDLTRGRAYANYGAHNERSDSPFNPGEEWSPYLPVVVGLDFNVAPMAWTLGQSHDKHCHFGDEIYDLDTHTQKCAEFILVPKLLELPIDIKRVGVELIGDASGKADKTSAVGHTDYSLVCAELDRAGIRWVNLTPTGNPSVRDRVNTVNARLKSGAGEVRLTINPIKAKFLKRDFTRQVWKDGGNYELSSGTKKDLGHMSDGAGYVVHVKAPIELHGGVGVGRVIKR